MRGRKDKRPGIMLYFDDVWSMAKSWGDEDLGRLLRAVILYAYDGTEADFSDNPFMQDKWLHFKCRVEEDGTNYQAKCEENAHRREYGVYKQKQIRAGKQYLSWDDYQKESEERWREEHIEELKDNNDPLYLLYAHSQQKNGKLGGRPKKSDAKEEPFYEQNPFGWDIKDKGLEGLFKSKEMADKMLEWLDYRYELGGFTESASRKAIEQARQAEIRYGPQRCIETMDQCMAGGYKAIIWEKLERNKGPSSKQTDDTTDYLARRIIEEEEKEGKQ